MRFKILHFLTILSCYLFTYSSFGQDVKSFHVDSTGKVFVNPGTPVFLYMSTKPDGSDAVRLQSIQPEGNPMYWDGHGPHYLNHLNLYLGRKIRFDLFADGRPPKTSSNFDVKKGIQNGNVIYLSGTCVVELEAIDANSGVYNIFYSLNGAEFLKYNKPIVLDNEGEYNLKFYAIDNVGNKEDIGERTLVVDTLPPVTILEIEEPKYNEVISGKSKISLKADDAVGVNETFYSLDGNPEKLYKQSLNSSQLSEGDHTITWYSIDIVGNIEVKNSFIFFVDKTPPMVFEEIVGNTYIVSGKEFSSGRSQLRIVAVDNKAGVKEIHYSVNNNDFKLYDKPIYLSEITGAVSVRSFAIDNVDNKGMSDAQGQQFTMPEVDISGPGFSHSYIGQKLSLRDTIWISPETKISISASDNGSGTNRIEYKLNEEPSQAYTEAFTVSHSGFHKMNCTAWDNVDNLNLYNFSFGVDAKAPDIFHNFSVKPYRFIHDEAQNIPVYSLGVSLFLAATDDISGVVSIFVSINGAKERAYSEPLIDFKEGQTHTVTLRVLDKLGNVARETVRFRVE